tara:strand:+ start:517 stop:744 length:228 start_codon:yes stop_codon:yes gene_type:complete
LLQQELDLTTVVAEVEEVTLQKVPVLLLVGQGTVPELEQIVIMEALEQITLVAAVAAVDIVAQPPREVELAALES